MNFTTLFREAGHPRSAVPTLKRASTFVFPHKSRKKRKRGTSVTGRGEGHQGGGNFYFYNFGGKEGFVLGFSLIIVPQKRVGLHLAFYVFFGEKRGRRRGGGGF